eukprot:6194177-Pleurochrysis_carterae.AAC.2
MDTNLMFYNAKSLRGRSAVRLVLSNWMNVYKTYLHVIGWYHVNKDTQTQDISGRKCNKSNPGLLGIRSYAQYCVFLSAGCEGVEYPPMACGTTDKQRIRRPGSELAHGGDLPGDPRQGG